MKLQEDKIKSQLIVYSLSLFSHVLPKIVAFGGIAGLFLGISLLSIAEFMFYIAAGLIAYLRGLIRDPNEKKTIITVISKE